ncbi:hypothetical protein GEMRC1_013160 [Eukaryota sp. GEM-RC1]
MDIDNVEVVLDDVDSPEVMQHLNMFLERPIGDKEGLMGLIIALQKNLPEAKLEAERFLHGKTEPDCCLILQFLAAVADNDANEAALFLFFREYLLQQRLEALCSVRLPDYQPFRLIRNFSEPMYQCCFLLLMIYHIPDFLRDSRSSNDFVEFMLQLLPQEEVQKLHFDELHAAFRSDLPPESLYYKAEKIFRIYVDYRVRMLQSTKDHSFCSSPETSVFLVFLCEWCHVITKEVPSELRQFRTSVISTLRRNNWSSYRALMNHNSLRESFTTILSAMMVFFPQNSTIRYIKGQFVELGTVSTDYLVESAELGCSFALIGRPVGFVVTERMSRNCALNFFKVAQIFVNHRLFMEAFLFVNEGKSCLQFLPRNELWIDLTIKIYLCVGRFDLVRQLCEQHVTATTRLVTDVFAQNAYFKSIDVFLWFNCCRPGQGANVRNYLEAQALRLNPQTISAGLRLVQIQNSVRISIWNQIEKNPVDVQHQVVDKSIIFNLYDSLVKYPNSAIVAFRNMLLTTIMKRNDSEINDAHTPLDDDRFVRETDSVTEKPDVHKYLKNEAQCNINVVDPTIELPDRSRTCFFRLCCCSKN